MTVVRYCREKREKYTEKCGLAVILSAALLLAGCQSASHAPSAASAERPAQAMRSMDGLQDERWEITQISGQKAKFFHHQPYLQFGSQFRQLRGNSGCNELAGSYELDAGQRTVKLNARAGHFSCDGALAQEAVLMDALQDAERFQLKGGKLILQDKSGRDLLQAQKK
ncbi:META domain-containing protein [Acinetobacter sp.]|uniref:META domain-containing protein n=1 Tax=Acinetobacter sp. TaxID=472 RepID=UPI0035B38A3D